jgi:hypothetical protein
LDGFPVGMPRAKHPNAGAELVDGIACSSNTTNNAMSRGPIAFELKRLDQVLPEYRSRPSPELAEFHQGVVDFNHPAPEIMGTVWVLLIFSVYEFYNLRRTKRAHGRYPAS